MNDNTPEIIKRAIAMRTAQGLKLTFLIPADEVAPSREWTCYPHDFATRNKWIANGAAKGWTVVNA